MLDARGLSRLLQAQISFSNAFFCLICHITILKVQTRTGLHTNITEGGLIFMGFRKVLYTLSQQNFSIIQFKQLIHINCNPKILPIIQYYLNKIITQRSFQRFKRRTATPHHLEKQSHSDSLKKNNSNIHESE